MFCSALVHGFALVFIKPRKSIQNSYIERFDRTYRDKVLYMYILRISTWAREITDNWIRECNEERLNDVPGDLSPSEYLMVNNPLESPELGYAGFWQDYLLFGAGTSALAEIFLRSAYVLTMW